MIVMLNGLPWSVDLLQPCGDSEFTRLVFSSPLIHKSEAYEIPYRNLPLLDSRKKAHEFYTNILNEYDFLPAFIYNSKKKLIYYSE